MAKEHSDYEWTSPQSDVYRFKDHRFMDIHTNKFCASDQWHYKQFTSKKLMGRILIIYLSYIAPLIELVT